MVTNLYLNKFLKIKCTQSWTIFSTLVIDNSLKKQNKRGWQQQQILLLL